MKHFAMPFLVGFCSFLGGVAAVTVVARSTPSVLAQGTGASPTPAVNDLVRLSERFEQVARRVCPAVVAIEAIKDQAKPGGKSRPVEESGSGVLVRVAGQNGLIVITNNHVVQEAKPNKITLSLADNRILKPTQVWADPESDVALLRIEPDNQKDIPVASLGDSDTSRVGQWVLAVGSPFGLNQTVTHGIISARERGQVSLGSTIRIKDFLQTDAAINPGSSGGPLANLDGDVIGINTAIASNSGNSSGVGFSIPINLVKRVMKQLLDKGSVTRGYLGLQVATSFEATDAAKLGLSRAQGAWIENIYPDTPAAVAGIKANDVILQVDSVEIRNENHFINLISSLTPGQRVRIQLWRGRETMTVEAVIGDWSKAQGRFRPAP
jgi:S1-C subfamily serine protease